MSVDRRTLVLALALAACVVASAGAGVASAATPGEITTVAKLPEAGVCFINGIAAAPVEGVLVRDCEGGSPDSLTGKLVNVRPDGQLVPLAAPEAGAGPVVEDPDGGLWIGSAQNPFGPAYLDHLEADGSVARIPLEVERTKAVFGQTPGARVVGLTYGVEGALWAAIGEGGNGEGEGATYASIGGRLLRIAPDGTQTEFRLPHQIEPRALALGPDGNLWFTAVRGLYHGEKTSSYKRGYIGRATPTGDLSFFRLTYPTGFPTALAAAPDGKIWFVEGLAIGTIDVDGVESGRYILRSGYGVPSGLTFGPEGDAWIPTGDGLVRITEADQQTRFPVPAKKAVTAADGDIWSIGGATVSRLVPGAPGLDVKQVKADRASRAADVRLACGGSSSGCEGTLGLALQTPRPYRRAGHSGVTEFPLAQVPYSVPAESATTLQIAVPAKAFSIAAFHRPNPRRRGLRVIVEATVAGGPSLARRIPAPSFDPS